MKRFTLKSVFLSSSLLLGALSAANAQGYLPPVPAPLNFTVSVASGNVYATWTATYSGYATLAVDGATLTTIPEPSASVSVQSNIDATQPHRFTLTPISWGGPATAAVYNYVPPVVPTGCNGQHVVNVNVINYSSDTVIGYLADGGSSGLAVNPSQWQLVPLWTQSSTGGTITGYIQAYEQNGVPYPASYHNVNFSCTGSFDYAKACVGTNPVVASFSIWETAPGQFTCQIAATN